MTTVADRINQKSDEMRHAMLHQQISTLESKVQTVAKETAKLRGVLVAVCRVLAKAEIPPDPEVEDFLAECMVDRLMGGGQ